MKNISENLKNLRIQYGYTQKYVAEKLNIKYQSYQAYENGQALPNIYRLIDLADLYDVSTDYLLGRKDI